MFTFISEKVSEQIKHQDVAYIECHQKAEKYQDAIFVPSVLRSSSMKEQSWISELMNAVSSLALSAEALSVTSCPSRLSFFLSLSPSRCLLLPGVMRHYLLIRSRVSGLWLIWNAFGGSMFSDLTSCFNQAIISSHPLQQTECLSVWEFFSFFFFSQGYTHTYDRTSTWILFSAYDSLFQW